MLLIINGKNDSRLASNVNFVMFSSLAFFSILNAHISNLFSFEVKFFATQHSNGWYTCGSYYLAKSLFDATTILSMVIIFAYVIDIYSTVSPKQFFLVASDQFIFIIIVFFWP
ncbi:hypothetical protein DERF_011861 [Dermatophagoides farinae]|uniref:Uncharacterized protein n=1 Tax=Dermatophagoides farinae TaxID=6954 RepID=A0A922HTU5_DERFA|nr:hypothetical protein DERF_011861 [Dermatophagoides farinae]